MMPRVLARIGLAAAFAAFPALAQQQPAPESQADTNSQQQASDDQQAPDSNQQKPPSKLKKILKRAAPNCAHAGGAGGCWSESEREKEAQQKQQQGGDVQQPPLPPTQPAPRSPAAHEGESSSRDTQIDLSPPPGDKLKHEGADISDVEEFHPYDPHRAMKDVEIGDFYFKRGNYAAAESRYAEALEWKPNDAIATFHLAESQEKLGKLREAVKNYQGYLKILPKGEYAAEAKRGIARLGPKLQSKETPPTSPPGQKRQ